ncbi:subtilisin-like serine protease PR1C [Ophiocordyceps camponoti-floridani]|uniref:Subtilisin-like serine protease PR1C n=1 Tax=Ophiocordyceps camponoti-floridani TaxID=2030778 RepID=A0A8H4Q354_9HYPO|nr:subtilisin-like serine protease PR1C [Ophiocordyceps camponoti-floridani]
MIETRTAQSILDGIHKGVTPLVTVPPQNMAQWEHRETLNEAPGSIARFSSWGPSWDLGLKPSLRPTAVKLPPQGSETKSQLILRILPDLASPLIRAYLVPVVCGRTGKSIGQLHGFPVPFFPSKVGDQVELHPKTHFTWDGLLENGSHAPEGDYAIVVRALRIFGDAARDEDWDESRSPAFTISYAA